MSYPGTGSHPAARQAAGAPSGKPLPDLDDPLTRPFWEAASEGRLVIQQCRDCGEFHHPPAGLCWRCLSADLAFRELSGRGYVHSFAIVHDQRIPAFDDLLPYVVASVSLDGAPEVTLTTNLPGIPIADVRSGMPVMVEFESVAPGVAIPQFRAAGPARGERA